MNGDTAVGLTDDQLRTQVQRLIDESDLRRLLQRYAKGIIERDNDLVIDCFTPDLRLDYGFTVIEDAKHYGSSCRRRPRRRRCRPPV